MPRRLVSVGDDFTLPAAVKAADANLPTRLSDASLSATYAPASVVDSVAAKLGSTEAAATYATKAAVAGASAGLDPLTVFIGDSITIGSVTTGTYGQNGGRAWPTLATAYSNGKLRNVRNAGVSGQTSAQMAARFATDVLAYNPQTVVITAGTNDLPATTQTDWQNNIIAMVNATIAAGAKPVLGAIYPRDTYAAQIATWNTWLYAYANTNKIPVIPFDTLADPATGTWPTGWSSDGIHPTGTETDAALRAIGKLAWDTLAPLMTKVYGKPPMYNGGDKLPNGFFTTPGTIVAAPAPTNSVSTASGTLPAGTYSYKVTTRTRFGESLLSAETSGTLSGAGTITLSIPAVTNNQGYRIYRKAPGDSDWLFLSEISGGGSTVTFADNGSYVAGAAASGVDTSAPASDLVITVASNFKMGMGVRTQAGVRGKVLRLTTTVSDASSGLYVTPATVAVVEGEKYALSALVATDEVAKSRITVQVNLAGGSSPQARVLDAVSVGSTLTRHVWEFTIPAGITSMRPLVQCSSGTSGWVDIAEMGLRKIN